MAENKIKGEKKRNGIGAELESIHTQIILLDYKKFLGVAPYFLQPKLMPFSTSILDL